MLQRVLQCVAVCCSVLQCVAVCCSALQCVAVCCVLRCVEVCCSVLQCVAVCCSVLSVLQCVAVCCSVLQCVAVCCSVLVRTGTNFLDFRMFKTMFETERSMHYISREGIFRRTLEVEQDWCLFGSVRK